MVCIFIKRKRNTLSCQNKDEIEKIVYQIIRQINQVFEIDFSNDYDLINGLNTHIASLIIRQENHVKITNLYLEEIKKNYPLIFDMAVNACQRAFSQVPVYCSVLVFIKLLVIQTVVCFNLY
ncbi:PRD domain-containing protein [Eggerthia catenaformis]|uniref:PRD domain-containing protein n=1 Tax=Eggerthia catenaformis TaxID=31973 RepID=UPI003C6FA523